MEPLSSALFVSAQRRRGYRFVYRLKRSGEEFVCFSVDSAGLPDAMPCNGPRFRSLHFVWQRSLALQRNLLCPFRSSARNLAWPLRQVVINSSRSPLCIQYATIKTQCHT
jgi:hypothetical protein